MKANSQSRKRTTRQNINPKNNDGTFKNTKGYGIPFAGRNWNPMAIFIPKRKKVKGYQRNNTGKLC